MCSGLPTTVPVLVPQAGEILQLLLHGLAKDTSRHHTLAENCRNSLEGAKASLHHPNPARRVWAKQRSGAQHWEDSGYEGSVAQSSPGNLVHSHRFPTRLPSLTRGETFKVCAATSTSPNTYCCQPRCSSQGGRRRGRFGALAHPLQLSAA